MSIFIKMTALITSIISLLGCSSQKPQMLDGDGSVYVDADYRTEYANVLDFDSCEGNPYFAVAFLGYGEDLRQTSHEYTEELFSSLGEQAYTQVGEFTFEGDEWYLIVPRYKDEVEVTSLDIGETKTVYQGIPFIVKCNLSDLHSNVSITTFITTEHTFSPQVGGDGKLITTDEIYDITDYERLEQPVENPQ